MINVTKCTEHAFNRFLERGCFEVNSLEEKISLRNKMLEMANLGFPSVPTMGKGKVLKCSEYDGFKFMIRPISSEEGIIITVVRDK